MRPTYGKRKVRKIRAAPSRDSERNIKLTSMKALLFMEMKKVVEQYLERYTEDNAPPPCQILTITNNGGRGNLHLIQKVFEGPFEVCNAEFQCQKCYDANYHPV
jgi:hypothetical protein